jgi:hypothetical protein
VTAGKSVVLVVLAASSLFGCGVLPRRVSLDDPEVRPLLEAMAVAPRTALGFTPIAPSSELRLEGAKRQYDAMLHVHGRTSRTIAFAREGDHFVWIGEQEIHSGPREYETVDGTQRESITLTFETRPISGVPLGTLSIVYAGDDPTLVANRPLTRAQSLRVLARWRQ